MSARLITTGTADPGEILTGITTFTCINPATNPGAPPAYCTTAGWPPIIAVTTRKGVGNGTVAGLPSIPGGVVRPSPVAYSTRTLPARMGLVVELSDPSALIAAACPEPVEFAVIKPGAAAANGTVTGCDTCPW